MSSSTSVCFLSTVPWPALLFLKLVLLSSNWYLVYSFSLIKFASFEVWAVYSLLSASYTSYWENILEAPDKTCLLIKANSPFTERTWTMTRSSFSRLCSSLPCRSKFSRRELCCLPLRSWCSRSSLSNSSFLEFSFSRYWSSYCLRSSLWCSTYYSFNWKSYDCILRAYSPSCMTSFKRHSDSRVTFSTCSLYLSFD